MRRWGGVALAMLYVTAPTGAHAQAPERSDSTDTQETRGPNHGPMMLAFAVFGAGMVFAPPALLYVPGEHDPTLGFGPDQSRVTVLSSGGYADAETGTNGWSYTTEVEGRRGRVFGGYRRTTYALARNTDVDAVHLGYFFRALDWAEGGASLGYQRSDDDRLDDGMLVALPMRAGSKSGALLLEPRYHFSGTGLRLGWRIQLESFGLPKPIMAGFRVDIQQMRRHDDTIGTYALLLGVRW